jgi:hypothetical protein
MPKPTLQQRLTVAGGKLDDKGASIGWNISKRIFRAMIDSALGLDPQDMSEPAKAKRQLRGLADLNGISFVAKVTVELNNDPRYPDHNRLDHPVLPTEKEWRAVMNGEDVPPRPSKPRSVRQWPRGDGSGAGVGQRTAEAGGGTTDDRRTALAAASRTLRTGSAADGVAGR